MKVIFKNLGTVNKNLIGLRLKNGDLYIWFSYETPVAFEYQMEMFVRQNDWSVTTGKLLNELEPDHSKRIDGDIFENKLNKLLEGIN